jgi:hypothetical protein
MNYPQVLTELDCVHHAKGVALERQRNLEHAETQAMQRFRSVRLSALCRDSQGR